MVRIRDALAERTTAIRALTHTLLRLETRRIFKEMILKMVHVVIRTVTMLWTIRLLLMIKINDSKIRQHLKRVFPGRCKLCAFSVVT